MLMNNLLEYSRNYSMPSGNLWNYYRDKIDDADVNNSASDGKSFEYKAKIVGKTPERPTQPERHPVDAYQPTQLPVLFLNVKLTIPLKYVSNFWRFIIGVTLIGAPILNFNLDLIKKI